VKFSCYYACFSNVLKIFFLTAVSGHVCLAVSVSCFSRAILNETNGKDDNDDEHDDDDDDVQVEMDVTRIIKLQPRAKIRDRLRSNF